MKNPDQSLTSNVRPLARGRQSIFKNQWVFLLVVQVGLAVITGLVNPRFFTLSNLMTVLEQIAVLGIVSSGMTLLLISGEIDISVGANIGITTCLMAMMMGDMGPVIPVLTGIGLATLNSSLVGLTSIYFKAPSFITSLALISVFRGIALAFTRGTMQTIYGKFETIGATFLGGFLPLSFLFSILAYLAVHSILILTRLGRGVYAIGSNPSAAYLSGISVKKTKISAFLINGVLVGIAATILLSRIGAAQPSTGTGLELRAIGAVVIGGTPLSGGKGRIIGTFFGVLLMGIISNSMNMLRVNPYLQEVTFGLLIIASLGVSVLSVYRKGMI